MTATGSTPATMTLTTDGVRPSDRVEFWRDAVSAMWGSLVAEPVDQSFQGTMTMSPYGQVGVGRVAAGGQVVRRLAADPRPECLINLQLSGVGRVTQAGRTAVLHRGDIALYDATQAYELTSDGENDQLVLQVPRQEVINRNLHIESAVARTVGGAGAAAVASSFAYALLQNETDVPDALRKSLGRQVVDCTVMALAQLEDTTTSKRVRWSVTRQQILRYVEAHVCDPTLSVKSIAQAFDVSTRTLQKLFADDEMHLSARVRRARLARARDALHDPLRAHQNITRISDDFGFSHASHFAREFRAEFGCSPHEHRQQH